MDGNHLSERLKRVAESVPEGARLADIGSDHAYLPVYLAKKGLVSYAVAGEVVKGPYENAKTEIEGEQLENTIHPRLADGLAAVESSDQIDTVAIAGMGGALISSILESGKAALKGVTRLILQPNIGEENVRRWLQQNHYQIVEEAILFEDGHYYEIIVADFVTDTPQYNQSQLLFGPFLKESKSAVFVDKWTAELNRLRGVEKQIRQSTTPPEDKLAQVTHKMKLIEEALA